MNISLYQNNEGISCVENGLIAIMSLYEFPKEAVYLESYVSAQKVFCDFLLQKAKYSMYLEVPRLQATASRMNYVETSFGYEPIQSLKETILNELIHKMPILLAIKKEYLPYQQVEPWENIHYSLMYKSEEETCFFLNDYPKCDFTLAWDEIINAYNGSIITFKINNYPDVKEYNKYIGKWSEVVATRNYKGSKNIQMSAIAENLEQVRDAIGIIKVTRNRMYQWMSCVNLFLQRSCFSEQSILEVKSIKEKWELLYFKIEYLRAKNNVQNEVAEEICALIIQDEKVFGNVANEVYRNGIH